MNRPIPKPPRPVKPVQTYQSDLLIQDMTTILSLCHADPMRVRAHDNQLFSRTRTLIEDHLVTLPDWIKSLNYYSPTERIDSALYLSYDLTFVSTKGKQGKDYRMEVSKKGLSWLALTAAKRVQFMFDLLHEHEGYWTSKRRGRVSWWPGVNLSWLKKMEKSQVKMALDGAFLQLAPDVFYDLDTFLAYQSRQANPLKEHGIGDLLTRMFSHWNYFYASEEDLEKKWKEFLFNYAMYRLAVMGGIKLGLSQENKVCLALTPWGQYYLGLTDEFVLSRQEAQDVLVQPNFEIVFLGPYASAEAEIGRFAERVGKGVGTLFKITKTSILHAADVGLTAKQVLSTLEKVSTKTVPPNISREITGWFASCRRIRIKSTILIHCPDEETALKIQSLGKQDVTPLSRNILELSSAKAKKTLIAKLRKQGIFIS